MKLIILISLLILAISVKCNGALNENMVDGRSEIKQEELTDFSLENDADEDKINFTQINNTEESMDDKNKSVISLSDDADIDTVQLESNPTTTVNNDKPTEMKTIDLQDNSINQEIRKMQEIVNPVAKVVAAAPVKAITVSEPVKASTAKTQINNKPVDVKAKVNTVMEKSQKNTKKDNKQNKKSEIEQLKKKVMHKKPYAFESRIEKVTDPVELLHKSQNQIKHEIVQAENQLMTNQQQTNLISQKLEQEVTKVSNLNSEVKNLLAQNAKLRKNVQKTNNDNKAKKSNVVDFIQKYEAKIQNLDEQLVKDHQEIEEKKTQEARLSSVLTKFLGEFEGLRDMVKNFKKDMSAMVNKSF